jgi:hypothetical protein
MSYIARIDLVMLLLFPLVWSFLSIVAWESFKSWRNRD